MTEASELGMGEGETRLHDELALLQAMYPEQVEWDSRKREILFLPVQRQDIPERALERPLAQVSLVLRLPDDYLSNNDNTSTLPIVLSATGIAKQDLRTMVIARWQALSLKAGEEVLDQILIDFQAMVDSQAFNLPQSECEDNDGSLNRQRDTGKTVVIWLHHLLALGKRKLALNPSLASTSPKYAADGTAEQISGITKPGYPGIMVFAGPADLVDSHIEELKRQRWQAFHIRFEEMYGQGCGWTFTHGTGITEVETMAELVAGIQGEDHREAFLTAAGVR